LPAAGLSAHTAQALATGPVSAAIPNANLPFEPAITTSRGCLRYRRAIRFDLP